LFLFLIFSGSSAERRDSFLDTTISASYSSSSLSVDRQRESDGQRTRLCCFSPPLRTYRPPNPAPAGPRQATLRRSDLIPSVSEPVATCSQSHLASTTRPSHTTTKHTHTHTHTHTYTYTYTYHEPTSPDINLGFSIFETFPPSSPYFGFISLHSFSLLLSWSISSSFASRRLSPLISTHYDVRGYPLS
jgi:hypothetical protein